ncbi:MAG: DNA double-strand break repair nuclease NurA, partial [Pyrobaculum sp.]
KRVRSRYLSLLAGRCLPVNDKVAASAMLRPGEYFSLGKLRDLLPRWVSIHYADCEGGPEREAILKCYRGERVGLSPKGERLCRRLVEFGQNFNAVLTTSTYPHLRLLGDVEVVYYMPPGHRTAVRVEVLDMGGLGVGEIVSYLASTTSTVTGYPQILDAVDQYVRVSPDLVEAVLTALLSKTPESLTHLMWPTNMQKRLASRY